MPITHIEELPVDLTKIFEHEHFPETDDVCDPVNDQFVPIAGIDYDTQAKVSAQICDAMFGVRK